MLEKDGKKIIHLAFIYAGCYSVIGFFGLFLLFTDLFSAELFINDPIESFLLILIAIIYFRGYSRLINKDRTGTAFIFVAAIMGLILAGLSSLDLIVNGILRGFLEEFSLSTVIHGIIDKFSITIVIGFFSIIPFKIIQSIESNLEEN